MSEEEARKAGEAICKRIEDAWNTGDGHAFGEAFTEDADFVDIRGDHHRGRRAIAGGHQAILDSIYKGSKVKYEVTAARELGTDVRVLHARATLDCPAGPLAGVNQSTITSVLVRSDGGWKISAFQNTLVAKHGR